MSVCVFRKYVCNYVCVYFTQKLCMSVHTHTHTFQNTGNGFQEALVGAL